jgi:hypothetical protein
MVVVNNPHCRVDYENTLTAYRQLKYLTNLGELLSNDGAEDLDYMCRLLFSNVETISELD